MPLKTKATIQIRLCNQMIKSLMLNQHLEAVMEKLKEDLARTS